MHHAYLLVGGSAEAEEFLHDFWRERGVTLKGSPDFFAWREALFGIEEARKLAEAAAKKAFTGKKIFLVAPERITVEAQNALLKTFEDPYDNTHFFLVAREAELVIPTLRSRMQTLHVKSSVEGHGAENFLQLSVKERLNFVRKFVDHEKNLSAFLDELLRISRSRKVYDVRKWSDDRAASPRLILEHLAVVL